MTVGDVVFYRVPITIDPTAPADVTLTTVNVTATLLTSAKYDIVNTFLVPDTGVAGTKQVLLVVAREK